MDSELRSCNLVIYNLTEPESPNDDPDSIQEIFNWIGAESTPFEYRRIGRRYPHSCRPVLVTRVSDKHTRDQVLDKFGDLDDDSLGTVRVKKDMNPAFRSEWRRLYEVERKAKMDYPDSVVFFDKVKRRVLCDKKIIDYWHP